MAKKLVKKRKLRVFRLFIMLLILVGLVFLVYLILTAPTKNIIVKGNKYLSDDDIIDLVSLRNYPGFFTKSSKGMQKKLEKSIYINKSSVNRKFYHTFVITVNENKPLFINNNNSKIVFSNKKEVNINKINKEFRIPRLINYVPDDKYKSFVNGMSLIKDDVLGKISDIEYQPNELDKDRFLVYMDDSNMVYLTLTKFKMINYYNDVLEQLEDKKGILYLDNGNHFQIKE